MAQQYDQTFPTPSRPVRTNSGMPNVTTAVENRRKMLERLRQSNVGHIRPAERTNGLPNSPFVRDLESPGHFNSQEVSGALAQLNGVYDSTTTVQDERLSNSFDEEEKTTVSSMTHISSGLKTRKNPTTPIPDIRDNSETSFYWSNSPLLSESRNPLPTGQAGLQNLAIPARTYGGALAKVQEHFGADNVHVGYTFLDPPTPIIPPRHPARKTPARAWPQTLNRLSNRLSLTPSEMPHPISLMREHDPADNWKAEEMLGLRRRSLPPPLPPKDFTNSSSADTLPVHKGTGLESTLEPQNGRTAWLHAITAMLIVFNCWGMTNAFGLFQAYYERDFLHGTSPSAISWIGSTQLALVFGSGVPAGRLVDKGYFRTVFHGGSALLVFGLFCSAACKHFWQLLLVQGFITGLGMGMTCCAGLVALMTWWDARKIGSAMGLAAAGSSLGGIVYVTLARYLLRTSGFKTTMLVIGAVATATIIPPNLVFRIRGNVDGPKRGRQRSKSLGMPTLSWRTFASLPYLLAGGGMFFAFLGVYFGFIYMILFASTEVHLSDNAATNLLIFMLAANLPGRFLPALISDRCIGPLNTIIPSAFLSSAVIWIWTVSDNSHESLIVIACFYGFASAGIQVLAAPTIYTFCLEPVKLDSSTEDTKLAMDRVGLKAGGIFSAIGVGCLIGLPVGGALISYRTDRGMSKPYLGAQIFAGACLLMGGCLLLGSRVAKTGWAAKRA